LKIGESDVQVLVEEELVGIRVAAKDAPFVDICHAFGCLLCPFEPLTECWSSVGLPEILSNGTFELDDSIVIAKDLVDLGFDIKTCERVGVGVLLIWIFEYGVIVDTA
jgi:hypothetical protein